MLARDDQYDRRSRWIIGIVHACTGILFLVLNGFIYYALLPGHWGIALAYDPFFVFCCWGWYAEGRAIWTGEGGLS